MMTDCPTIAVDHLWPPSFVFSWQLLQLLQLLPLLPLLPLLQVLQLLLLLVADAAHCSCTS